MCLDIIYQGKQKKEALAKLPESGYYWKTMSVGANGRYYPICFALPNQESYKTGWNKTSPKYIRQGYNVAFHVHRTKEVAKGWRGTVIRCIVKKEDIVAIGTQNGDICIVTKRIWIPKPRAKTA